MYPTFFLFSEKLLIQNVKYQYVAYNQDELLFSTRIVYNFYMQKLYLVKLLAGRKKHKAFAYNH